MNLELTFRNEHEREEIESLLLDIASGKLPPQKVMVIYDEKTGEMRIIPELRQ